MYVTISDRRRSAIERLEAAASAAMIDLRAYARVHGGRFIVFGSTARGDLISSSDFDVIVDFPEAAERPARDFAEATCRQQGIVPDVHLTSETSEKLIARAMRDAIVLA